MAFSPDGRRILTGSLDRTVRIWDARTGLPITGLLAHRGEVLAMAFSPDGKTILTGCQDRTAQLWDADIVRPIAEPLKHPAPSRRWR